MTKSFKSILNALLFIALFIVFNSLMCSTEKEDEELFKANANGYYFVAAIDPSGALFNAGHTAFFLISPTEVLYNSLNMNPGRNFINQKVGQYQFNVLYQALVVKDRDFILLLETESAFDELYNDIQRYSKGFYLEVTQAEYNEMKKVADKIGDYDTRTNNCMDFGRIVLEVKNPSLGGLNLWFDTPHASFDALQVAAGGTPIMIFPNS